MVVHLRHLQKSKSNHTHLALSLSPPTRNASSAWNHAPTVLHNKTPPPHVHLTSNQPALSAEPSSASTVTYFLCSCFASPTRIAIRLRPPKSTERGGWPALTQCVEYPTIPRPNRLVSAPENPCSDEHRFPFCWTIASLRTAKVVLKLLPGLQSTRWSTRRHPICSSPSSRSIIIYLGKSLNWVPD